jgi:hypothetical protein
MRTIVYIPLFSYIIMIIVKAPARAVHESHCIQSHYGSKNTGYEVAIVWALGSIV